MCTCKICENKIGNTQYSVREMMFGYKDRFDYFQCSQCGCLQIKTIPVDLSKYYPHEYYSLLETKEFNRPALFSYIKRTRFKHATGNENLLGAILCAIGRTPRIPDWAQKAGIHSDSRILDIGCGQGQWLLDLSKKGFTSLTGIDPYIRSSIRYKCGVTIQKSKVEDIQEQFDFVTLNHSFEHMPDPFATFKKLREITKPQGSVLLRIPVADSYAWREYKTDWYQIDAPRHLFLYTRKSIEILANATGYFIYDISYDSNEMQFIGSEQYKRDIPLLDSRSYQKDKLTDLFSPEQILLYKTKAVHLNSINDGDSACFYLR